MTIKKIDAAELAETLTIITNFMGDPGPEFRTYDELLVLFNDLYPGLHPVDDKSNDLRTLKYIREMSRGEWTEIIVLVRETAGKHCIVTAGVHRGLAYLACVSKGIDESSLPEIYTLDK